MEAGGAKELNARQSVEAKARGGRTTGTQAAQSGRLAVMSKKGAARNREIAARFHASRSQGGPAEPGAAAERGDM